MIALLFALAAAEPSVDMATVCPRIERRHVSRYTDFPEIIRRFEGPMGERGVAWNSTDVIRAGDPRPLARFMAGGDMGEGRWLLVHESGGRMVFRHVDVWRIAPDGRLSHPVSESSGSLEIACEKAAARLDR